MAIFIKRFGLLYGVQKTAYEERSDPSSVDKVFGLSHITERLHPDINHTTKYGQKCWESCNTHILAKSGSQNYTCWMSTRKPKICFFLTFVLSINSTLRGHRALKIHPWILIISQTNIIYFTVVNSLARYITRVSGVISINCPEISRVSVPEMSDQGLNSSGISITNNFP